MLRVGTEDGGSLIRFGAQAAGVLLAPFLVQTAFMAFAPSAIGRFPYLVFGISIGTGLLALPSRRRRLSGHGVFLGIVYTVLMFFAMGYWTLFIGFGYFRDHLNAMFPHIGEL